MTSTLTCLSGRGHHLLWLRARFPHSAANSRPFPPQVNHQPRKQFLEHIGSNLVTPRKFSVTLYLWLPRWTVPAIFVFRSSQGIPVAFCQSHTILHYQTHPVLVAFLIISSIWRTLKATNQRSIGLNPWELPATSHPHPVTIMQPRMRPIIWKICCQRRCRKTPKLELEDHQAIITDNDCQLTIRVHVNYN